jgi:hypothetical protein
MSVLNVDLDVEVYMEVPDGIETLKENLMSKNLAPENLDNMNCSIAPNPPRDNGRKLMELGLCQCEADSNLCIPLRSSYFLLLYVDDVIQDGIRNVRNMIMPPYNAKDLGIPKFSVLKMSCSMNRSNCHEAAI